MLFIMLCDRIEVKPQDSLYYYSKDKQEDIINMF